VCPHSMSMYVYVGLRADGVSAVVAYPEASICSARLSSCNIPEITISITEHRRSKHQLGKGVSHMVS
jgi:hypothetical protein